MKECILPNNSTRIEEDEMLNIEGGTYVVAMREYYLSKANCTSAARTLQHQNLVYGMSTLEIAKELFAHAVCYYGAPGIATLNAPLAAYLASKGADGICIEDGGDSAIRKAFYSYCWNHL